MVVVESLAINGRGEPIRVVVSKPNADVGMVFAASPEAWKPLYTIRYDAELEDARIYNIPGLFKPTKETIEAIEEFVKNWSGGDNDEDRSDG